MDGSDDVEVDKAVRGGSDMSLEQVSHAILRFYEV